MTVDPDPMTVVSSGDRTSVIVVGRGSEARVLPPSGRGGSVHPGPPAERVPHLGGYGRDGRRGFQPEPAAAGVVGR